MKKLNSRHGFTLVELLIVISVSALLMLIALPARAKVPAVAGSSACTYNLKQIGTGIAMYCSDNNGGQPVNLVNWSRPGFEQSVVGLLVPYLKSGDHYRETKESHPTPWVCDADANSVTMYWNSSYGAVNLHLFPHTEAHFSSRVAYPQVKNPAAAFAIMDGFHAGDYPAYQIISKMYVDFDTDCNGNGIKESYQDRKFNWAAPRHADKINVLFVDGHAGTVDEAEFVKAEHWNVK